MTYLTNQFYSMFSQDMFIDYTINGLLKMLDSSVSLDKIVIFDCTKEKKT